MLSSLSRVPSTAATRRVRLCRTSARVPYQAGVTRGTWKPSLQRRQSRSSGSATTTTTPPQHVHPGLDPTPTPVPSVRHRHSTIQRELTVVAAGPVSKTVSLRYSHSWFCVALRSATALVASSTRAETSQLMLRAAPDSVCHNPEKKSSLPVPLNRCRTGFLGHPVSD